MLFLLLNDLFFFGGDFNDLQIQIAKTKMRKCILIHNQEKVTNEKIVVNGITNCILGKIYNINFRLILKKF